MSEADRFIRQAFQGDCPENGQNEHPSTESIAAYIAGTLPPSEAMELLIHICSCSLCMREVNDLRVTLEETASQLKHSLISSDELESAPKEKIAQLTREFLELSYPQEIHIFNDIWSLLEPLPLSEIAMAQPQTLRHSERSQEFICIPVLTSIIKIELELGLNVLKNFSREELELWIQEHSSWRQPSAAWPSKLSAFLLEIS